MSILCITIIVNNGLAQNTINTNYSKHSEITHIRWVNQFPSLNSENKAPKITKRISDFFFGKTPPILRRPISILAKNPDTLWVIDQGNGTVFHVNNKMGEIPQFVNSKFTNFTSLVGICWMPDNKILFTDSYLKKIFLISADKKELQVLNDSLLLEQPTGIAYSHVNNEIWVVETSAHRISLLDKNGNLIKRIGGRGNTPGKFNFPTFIWIDNLGTVYVVDSMNFRVQIFNKNGELVSVFGEIGDATGYFSRPKGIATDSYGNIYIADALFHTVQIFDKSGKYLFQFGNQGCNKEQFWMPTGIYIDDKDYIYVADSYNSRIQIFQLINGNLNENNSNY